MKESRLSQDCYVWFHNNYPELRGCYCLNLNNTGIHISINQLKKQFPLIPEWSLRQIVKFIENLNRRQAGVNKSSGLQGGRSDAVLYYKGGSHMIEFKKPGVGRHSKAQKQWAGLMRKNGLKYHTIDNIEDFETLIKSIIDDNN